MSSMAAGSADRGVTGTHLSLKGTVVIQLTRLNGNPIALNSDLIKFVENAPDTVITLINGEKIIVRESSEDVIHRIVDFRRAVMAGLPSWSGSDLNSAVPAAPRIQSGPFRGGLPPWIRARLVESFLPWQGFSRG